MCHALHEHARQVTYVLVGIDPSLHYMGPSQGGCLWAAWQREHVQQKTNSRIARPINVSHTRDSAICHTLSGMEKGRLLSHATTAERDGFLKRHRHHTSLSVLVKVYSQAADHHPATEEDRCRRHTEPCPHLCVQKQQQQIGNRVVQLATAQLLNASITNPEFWFVPVMHVAERRQTTDVEPCNLQRTSLLRKLVT